MPVAVEDLYSQEPSAARGTAYTANTKQGRAYQASEAAPVQSQDAEASYAGTRDAAAMSGSASQGQASLAAARDARAYGAGQAQVTEAQATGYNAQTGQIDPTETVSAQLADITSKDSPTMQRAAQMGMLQAGRRGLQNTSFAAGAAMGEMVDRALPMAQQQSQQAFQQRMQNQADINRALEVTSGRTTEVSMMNARERNQMAGLQAQLRTNVSLANASESNRLAALNAQMETDVSKFNADQLTQMSRLNAQLGTEVSMANAAAYNEASRLNAQLETAVSQGNQQEANRIRMRMTELNAEIRLNNAQMRTQVSLENAAAANRAALQNSSLRTEVSMQNAAAINTMRRDVLAQNASLNEQYLRGEQALDLASIQGRYQMLISSNETAARLYDSYFNSIAQAMGNEKIGPDRIAQYVNVQQSMLEAGLRMMDAMNDLDLGQFELPGATGTAGSVRKGGEVVGGTLRPTTGSGDAVAGAGDDNVLGPQDPGYWTEERLREQFLRPIMGAF